MTDKLHHTTAHESDPAAGRGQPTAPAGGWRVRHKDKWLPAVLALVGLVLLAVFHQPLIAWFFGGPMAGSAGEREAAVSTSGRAGSAGEAAEEEPLPPQEFSEAALTPLKTAYEAYEEIRVRLAGDTLEGLAARAARVAQTLKAAAAAMKDAPQVQEEIQRGITAAEQLAQTQELDSARLRFGELSRTLVLLAGADERLAAGQEMFDCSMATGYGKWIQTTQEMANPYMGQKMLQCGTEANWPSATAEASEAHAGHDHAAAPAGGSEVAYYTCPMHPSVKQKQPGTCPICAMDLTPVTQEEVKEGVIFVDAARRQLIGVKTAQVEKRQLGQGLRTVGKIAYDETSLTDVSLKFKGWIGKLHADATGKSVRRGQTLFTVYSPELFAAQQDLLIASGSAQEAEASGFSRSLAARNSHLVDAAKQRLKLWDVSDATIRQVLKTGKPIQYVPIASPASGVVVEKNVVDGSTVEPGARLLRLANLDKVWIEAELYESELPLASVGQTATVTLSYLPEQQFTGKVAFIYPYLDKETRTGQVRIELDNKGIELKPDMYANVQLDVDRGERVVVPESAVIYAGPRRLVFVDLGEGRLRPQEIEVGAKTGDYYEVLKGLKPGDKVVTSGNFLISAESRLKSSGSQW